MKPKIFVVKYRSEEVDRFYSRKDFFKFCYYEKKEYRVPYFLNPNTLGIKTYDFFYPDLFETRNVIVYDESGLVIPLSWIRSNSQEFFARIEKSSKERRLNKRLSGYTAQYRVDPVARTGGGGNRKDKPFREPQRGQERRNCFNHNRDEEMSEYRIKKRHKRYSKKMFIDARDEQLRSDFKNKSWKKQRKTQWK